MSVQERTVALKSGRHTAEVMEQGSGPDLVYIHGVAGLTWDPFLEALSQRFHVIALRLPGTGKSSGEDEILDHHDMLYVLLDTLDALGVERAHLVGHSLGGWLAAELAAMQPQRFERLALIAPLGLWDEARPVVDFFAYRSMPQVLAPLIFHDMAHPAAQAMLQPPPSDPEALKRTMVDSAKNAIVAAKLLWPIPDKGLRKRAHRISAPTLIIWGQDDGIVPVQYGEAFRGLIEGSDLQVIENAGHLPQIEQTEAVVAVVTRFLS